MKHCSLLLACLALLLLGASAPRAAAFSKTAGGHRDGYIVLLRLRYDLFARWKASGKWPDDPAANAALEGHVRYWDEQVRTGRALLAGGVKGDYWDNAAVIIIDAASDAEASSVVNGDPAVKAYVFQAQVRPFETHWVSSKYWGGTEGERTAGRPPR
ncbi:MAG TPA: YciI family protein [Thermoanaerobaculia bacterium]|jgi:uncharacterized protein YciI|nr:YciI family protein [Thermoanaerobaculia bacterium]